MNVQAAVGAVGAIIVWLFGEAGRMIVRQRWYEFRNVGRASGKTHQLQTAETEVICSGTDYPPCDQMGRGDSLQVPGYNVVCGATDR